MMTTTITTDGLIYAVAAGAVYCTNGDAAHTSDFIDDRDDLVKTIRDQGFREIDPDGTDFDEYADALARLDIFGSTAARVFRSGAYTFSPDSLRD